MLDRIRGKSQSIFTQIIFGLIILTFVFFGVGSFSSSSSNVVAVVNGEKLTTQDFIRIYGPIYQAEVERDHSFRENKAAVDELKRRVLGDIVVKKLFQQEAAKVGLFTSPFELSSNVRSAPIFLRDGKFDPELYEAFLRSNRMTAPQFEHGYAAEMLANKMQAYIASSTDVTEAEVKSFFDFHMEQRKVQYVLFPTIGYEKDVTLDDAAITAYYDNHQSVYRVPDMMEVEYLIVTPDTIAEGQKVDDAELAAYYEAHKEQFAEPKKYKVRHIYVACPPEQAQDADSLAQVEVARETITKAEGALNAGADFGAVAMQYSNDTSSAVKGGDLGWIKLADFPLPAFVQAIESLKVGEVSGVVRSELGMHIIALDDVQEAKQLSLEQVKDAVQKILARDKALAAEEGIRLSLVDELAKETDLESIAAMHGLKVMKSGLIPKASLLGLLKMDDDSVKMLDNLPLGKVAPAPVNITDGVALLKVLDSQPAHVAPFEKVKDSIKKALVEEEAKKMAHAAADKALAEFSGTVVPAAFTGQAATTDTFYRAAPMNPLINSSQELMRDLAKTYSYEWLPHIYDVAGGTVIARVQEIIPATEADWEGQGSVVMESLRMNKKDEMLQAFLRALFAKGEVEENAEVLDAIQLR